MIGGAALAPRLRRGLEMIGATTRLVDAGEATLAGLRAARMGEVLMPEHRKLIAILRGIKPSEIEATCEALIGAGVG